MEAEEENNDDGLGGRDREKPRGAYVDFVRVRGDVPPLEENSDLTDFTSESAHLLL